MLREISVHCRRGVVHLGSGSCLVCAEDFSCMGRRMGGGERGQVPVGDHVVFFLCVCCLSHLFWTHATPFGSVDAPTRVSQEEVKTGVLFVFSHYCHLRCLRWSKGSSHPFPSSIVSI